MELNPKPTVEKFIDFSILDEYQFPRTCIVLQTLHLEWATFSQRHEHVGIPSSVSVVHELHSEFCHRVLQSRVQLIANIKCNRSQASK